MINKLAFKKYIMFSVFMVMACKSKSNDIGIVKVTYSAVTGIGEEQGVTRRDPSDVIKINHLYYVWYSKGPLKTGYDATVWYATSLDGHQWTEKGMALDKGKHRQSATSGATTNHSTENIGNIENSVA